MANSDATEFFYDLYSERFCLILSPATDDSCSARNSLIHKEKFNIPLSGDEPKDLLNFVRHLKTFTGLAEIA